MTEKPKIKPKKKPLPRWVIEARKRQNQEGDPAHVKATTAPYKYPRRIEFVDALPKTISGKIQRALLRRRNMEE
jgi:acyl-coenzyme A synthetase/AMP-(fatty) acid ligase